MKFLAPQTLFITFSFFINLIDSNIKIITFLNAAYEDLLLNFACNLKILGLHEDLHVFISDNALVSSLNLMNISYTYITSGEMVSKNLSAHGENEYWKLARKKLFAFNMASNIFKEFIYSDVDILWLKSPYNDLRNNCKKDICFQSDKFKTMCDINSGFMYVRSSKKSKELFTKALSIISFQRFKNKGSQAILDFLLSKRFSYRKNIAILNEDEYPNGAYGNYWKNNLTQLFMKHKNIKILHNNWIRSKKKKIERNKSTNTWFIDENMRCKVDEFKVIFA